MSKRARAAVAPGARRRCPIYQDWPVPFRWVRSARSHSITSSTDDARASNSALPRAARKVTRRPGWTLFQGGHRRERQQAVAEQVQAHDEGGPRLLGIGPGGAVRCVRESTQSPRSNEATMPVRGIRAARRIDLNARRRRPRAGSGVTGRARSRSDLPGLARRAEIGHGSWWGAGICSRLVPISRTRARTAAARCMLPVAHDQRSGVGRGAGPGQRALDIGVGFAAEPGIPPAASSRGAGRPGVRGGAKVQSGDAAGPRRPAGAKPVCRPSNRTQAEPTGRRTGRRCIRPAGSWRKRYGRRRQAAPANPGTIRSGPGVMSRPCGSSTDCGDSTVPGRA